MAKRRWQPPPMNPKPEAAGGAPAGSEPAPRVRVDEQVVRNVLKVNPDLRDGRTTFQVKKALESGEPLSASATARAKASAEVVPPESGARSDQARQLAETLDFFMTSKGRELSGTLDEIAARRRLLDEEEKRAREDMRHKLVDFLLMLDTGVLALHGKEALQAHRELLSRIGLTATELLDVVKRGGK